jgi:DNA polymerase III epsilon subunit-like protein
MSVGGFTVGSVINPGVMTQVPSECEGVPAAREDLAPEMPTGHAPGESGLNGHTLDGRGLKGHAQGGAVLKGHAQGGAVLKGHALERPGLDGRGLDEGGRGLGAVGEADLGCLEFAVVDLETTGWSPGVAAITEIAAVRVAWGGAASRGRRRVGEMGRRGEFASLVNPGVAVPEGIAELTGIRDWMLAAAPRLGTVLPGLLEFARGYVLVAHNAPFDLGFLRAGCADCGLAWPGFTVLDTVMLARHVMDPDEVPDCKLGTLAGFFGARTTPSHRALADARATADVLGWLIRRLAHRGIRTLNQLSAWPDVVA